MTSAAYSLYFSAPSPLRSHGVLQQRDRLGVPLMVLAVAPPGVDAADGQQLLVVGGVGRRMAVERLLGEHVDADAADPRRGAGEVAVDERLLEADCLEDLRAAVGLDRRDPHLGDRLQQALADRLDDVALGDVDVVDAGHAAGGDEVADRVQQQVGVDRAAAVADQRGHVVDLARLAGLEHESGAQARALAHEVLVDGGDGQQRRDRRAPRPDLAVGQDQHADAVGDGVVGGVADLGQRRAHAVGAVADLPRDVQRVRAEDLVVDDAQRLELVVAQDRLVEDQLVRVLGRLGEQVALAADPGDQRHHDVLADRVDRRVGDLCEELLEVAEQRRAAVRQHGQRVVVAHRPERLGAAGGHRGDQHALVLLRVAERQLAQLRRLQPGHRDVRLGEVVEVHGVLLEPLAVGLARGDVALDLLVLDDAMALEVDEKQLARLQAPEALDLLGLDRQQAGLRAEDHEAVVGLDPAARTQPVAVERRADDAAVGEGDGGGPVPRLHQTGVEGVEALEMVGDVVAVGVGLRDHHHHRVRQRAAGEHQQLEHVVERRGVRVAGRDDRHDLLQVQPEEARGQLRLACAHPVDVAHQRVDLAVVGDHAVRVRERPAGERVRGEARVHERHRALHALVGQVGEEAAHLVGNEHPLVDDRARGERRDVEVGRRGELADAADDVQLALEGVLIGLEARAGLDDELAHDRPRRVGGLADVLQVDGDVAPAEHALALDARVELQQRLELRAALGILGQEADGDAVAPGLGQLEVHVRAKERMRHLQQHPGAVTGARVGARRAAVLEVLDGLQPLLDDLVDGDVVQPRDERDTARVVLVARVVEAVGLWRQGSHAHVSASEGRVALRRSVKGSSGMAPNPRRMAAFFGRASCLPARRAGSCETSTIGRE